MTATFTVACVQMNSGESVAENLRRAGELLKQAADGGATLAALPEYFAILSADETRKLAAAEADGAGPIQDFLSESAARHKMHLVGGAIPIRAAKDSDNAKQADAEKDSDGATKTEKTGGRVFSSCILFAPDGKRIARYDKMHLFRFDGAGGKIDETKTIVAGGEVVAANTPLGKIGLAVCYDIRFPELFRAMHSPDIIVAPSAFTPETGAAHWRVLLRARAVENLAHIVAPAQAGTHPGGRETFGDSVVLDGWGRILNAAQSRGDEVVFAKIDGEEREQMRAKLPALSHRLL